MNIKQMSLSQFAFKLAGALALSVCCTTLAAAQAARTWVSGVGDDANPCSRTAPCKSFAGAISKTAAGGEISVLDPGGYGAVTITKSITISGDGMLTGILSAGANAIVINAADTDVVILRSIALIGFGSGLNGIRFLNGKQLIVEKVTISSVTTHGIDVAFAAGKAGKVTIRDTNINSCAGNGVNFGANGTLQGTLDNVRIENCGAGVVVNNGNVTVSRSVIAQNTAQGLLAASATAVINAETCVLTNNDIGVSATTSGLIRLSNCNIAFNNTGIATSGGTVASFGNNKNAGNTTNGAPSLLLAQQ